MQYSTQCLKDKEVEILRHMRNEFSDTDEAYLVFRDSQTKEIGCYLIDYVKWDRELSWDDNPTISGEFKLQSLQDEDYLCGCKELVTEMKFTKQCNREIANLNDKIKQLTKQRNILWSSNILSVTERTIYSDMKVVENSNDNDLFAIWIDFNAYNRPHPNILIAMWMKLNEDFVNTDYFIKLFKPNIGYNMNAIKNEIEYHAPCTAIQENGTAAGCNHQFVIVNKKNFNCSADSLKFYEDEVVHCVRCNDKDYMKIRLNEIWKSTFGTEHE